MLDSALAAAGSGVGGAAGAAPGVLGRSPLLDLLQPLDYPRQALWNLVRGPARLLQGEGSLDDILGMAPGLAGAGVAALGPLGLLGGALAGGAVQGLGKMTGSPAFAANTPQDVTGSEDFLPNLAVGAATDPLTYAGLGIGGQAGRTAASRLAMRAAEPALAEGPEGILQALRMGLPQGGMERDAAVAGLGARNQGLGEAVGQLAQARQARPAALAEQVTQQAAPRPQVPFGDLAPAPPAPGPPSPEQAFEQMLPDFQRLQKIEAAQANPRNALPPDFEGLPTNQEMGYARLPVRELQQYPTIAEGRTPGELAQFRRWMALRQTGQEAGHDLAENWGPLTAELQKTGQLGPIEGRLQANWAMLGDQIQEGTLRQADLLSGIERNLTEDEAFRMLFERGHAGMPGGSAVWNGQQAALDHLLEGLGQAHPGTAGEPAGAIATALGGVAPGATFGGRAVLPAEIQQAGLARQLEGRLRDAALHEGAALRSRPLPRNFWEPGAAGAEPSPSALLPPGPSFPGEFSPGPTFPPLPEALARASQQLGRPLQPWEVQELERALAQRNPAPFQQRGLMP